MPIGQEDKFKGCIDLFAMKAIFWHDETLGAEYSIEEIPAELKKKAQADHQLMVETIVENDDGEELMAKYVEGEEISRGRAEGFAAQERHRHEGLPGDLRHGIQEQGRAAAAGCGG